MILSTGIGAVLYMSSSMHLRTSEEQIRKNAADSANNAKILFLQLIQQSEDRARGWALNSATGGKIDSQLSADSTIRGIEVYKADGQQYVFRSFQNNSSIQADPMASQKVLESLSGENLRAYDVIKTDSDQVLHRVSTPLQMDENGTVQLLLSYYLDPAIFGTAISGDGISHTMFFNKEGVILFQSKGADASGLIHESKIPTALLDGFSSPTSNLQMRVSSKIDEHFVGSFNKIGFSGLAIAVLTSEIHIFEQPRRTMIRAIYLGLAILLFSFAFVILLSNSLVRPIRTLVESTKKIAQGDFSVRSIVKSRDEIYTLATSFNEMASGLQEREKIKEIFGKFHSKAVVDKLFKEDGIKLGGERIPVTVFFSDIRGFTSSSETTSPEEVVEMLNEYLSEMVPIVELHDGVVDKFVGDAIMAVWGMPEANPVKDAIRAVETCLEMRTKLAALNERRKLRGKDELKIGMGLNSGVVIAGQIGSQTRMEYTVIGDTVNTASRMESATKEFGTDLLINESTAKLLPTGRFVLEGPIEATAKGKSDGMMVFKVLGYAKRDSKVA